MLYIDSIKQNPSLYCSNEVDLIFLYMRNNNVLNTGELLKNVDKSLFNSSYKTLVQQKFVNSGIPKYSTINLQYSENIAF